MTGILIVLILCYLVTISGIYIFQDKVIFQAVKLKKDFQFEFDLPFQEHVLKTADNEELNFIHFKCKENPKGIIVYFHGNADNLTRWGKYASDFTSLGYDVIMMDYRGYGKSTGTPNEEMLYKDAEMVWNWAKSTCKYTKWIIYGRSLGAAIASELAIDAKPDLLALETPFDDINGALAAKLVPFKFRYSFSNKDKLSKSDAKKIIFHGTNDWIVPLSSAEKLKPMLGSKDQMVVISKAGHQNLNEFEIYHTKLKTFLIN
jgi:uncharacterized protein